MKIKTKLRIVAILPVGFFLIVGLVLFLTSQQVNKVKEKADLSDALIKDMFDLDLLLHEYLLHHGERSQTQWQLKHDSIGKVLTTAEFKGTEGQSLLEDIRRNYQEIKVLFSQLVATAGIAASAELHNRLVGQILIKTQTIVSATKQLSVLSHANVITIQRRADLLIIVLLVILSVVMVVALFLIGDGVASPISKLHEGTEIIGSGNLDYKVGSVSKDEVGQLSRSFDEMTAKLKESRKDVEDRINEQKKLNEQLMATVREIEGFSYSVSHDLKAPLRAIDGFSQTLIEDYKDRLDEEGLRRLNIVSKNARKMGKLIEDILAYVKLGKVKPVNAKVDMEGLAHEVLNGFKQGIADREISIEIKSLPPAYGDKALIRQVFVNLIDNAIKFTGPKKSAMIEIGWIRQAIGNRHEAIGTGDETTGTRHEAIGTRHKAQGTGDETTGTRHEAQGTGDETTGTRHKAPGTGDEVVYYVKDNGVGFDMQYADKLFGVFLRLHGMDEFDGTGIGLAIVRRIIEKHGGRVHAEGRVGEGAVFCFTLIKDIRGLCHS